MRTPCCHSFLAFILKFLNFLQTFIGLSIIVYSVYMLNQWTNHSVSPPSSAPSPAYPPDTFLSNFDAIRVSDHLNLAGDVVSDFDEGFKLNNLKLPAPWFIYAFMSMGILLCCTTCIGHIAAEAINGCCLCFYTLLTVVLILLEASLVIFIVVDRRWEKDIPFDPTGELDNLRNFIEDNRDICEWVGITVLVIQALSLLIAIILRSMVSALSEDHDLEEDNDVGRGRTWEPLLNPQSQTSGSVRADGKGTLSDIWSSRMREKYGLNNSEAKHNLLKRST